MNILKYGMQLLLCLLLYKVNIVAQVVAFPGAEGFGKYTMGGRGGKVYVVTNLNDDGPGSFREAASAQHPRHILFAVSGTIHLKSEIKIRKNATIAGHTAPGDGICIADMPVLIGGDNIIVRYLRVRLGDRYQNKGMVHGSGHDDAFGGNRYKHIMIDHCTMSWSTDEIFSIYGGDSTTIQWNLLSEPLNYSYHFEKGDKDYERHGYGGIWGGRRFTAHHNLIAHCVSRTPRFQGIRYGEDVELVDFTNNVIYNWEHNNVYGGEGGNYNIEKNYYKYGPATSDKVKNRIVNPSKPENEAIGYGSFYVANNIVDGSPETTSNNKLGIHFTKNEDKKTIDSLIRTQPHEVWPIPADDALDAYEKVLMYAGASLPARDTLDSRIVNDVRNRTGGMIDVQGGFPHGTAYEQTIRAWPTLKEGKLLTDSDGDGLPDNWELSRGLNPNNAKDATQIDPTTGYDYVELYMHEKASIPLVRKKITR